MKSGIWWVGESNNWNAPVKPEKPLFAMALVEEEVLPVAFSNEYAGTTRLSKSAAINCTSRLAQRVALASTGLNPRWEPIKIHQGVLKYPASCHNNGVHFIKRTEHMELLAAYVPELAEFGVAESFLHGDPYEIDGVIIGGKIHFFHVIRQIWNEENDGILEYRRVEVTGIHYAAEQALRAVGLDNSPFCIEFRLHECQWRVIEVHARLGEDPGLPTVMSDIYPLDFISGKTLGDGHEESR
jgi:hypothetical protein